MVNIYLVTNPARRKSNAEAAFLTACEAELNSIDIKDRTYGASRAKLAPIAPKT